MITIVAHFRATVVNFIFGGRNSGQNRNGPDQQFRRRPSQQFLSCLLDCRLALIADLGIMRHDVFGKCKDAVLSVELDPFCGIRGKLDLTGFCPKPGDYVPNRTSPPELRQQ
jgi:hypothetical protein